MSEEELALMLKLMRKAAEAYGGMADTMPFDSNIRARFHAKEIALDHAIATFMETP